MMKQDFDYIIVGLGGLGSAALYWLSRRAHGSVLGLDQFEIGHVRGASQDHSRIIRLAYHTPAYVSLARQAYQSWDQLEKDAGEKFIITTGGLDFASKDSSIPISSYLQSLEICGISYELLDAAEIMRRWPPFRVSDDIHGLYQSDAGIVAADKCNAAHVRLAQEYGAQLHAGSPVTQIRPMTGEIEVKANGRIFRCRKLIITADAWSNSVLAHFGKRLPLTVTKEQVTYFRSPYLRDFQPDRFPVWVWLDEPCYYGFPVYGEQGIKAAQDVGGMETTAEGRTFAPDLAALHRVQDFLRKYLPAALGPILYTKTCLYTLLPDRDFVIDSVPGFPDVFVAIGSGHSFKFASLIGKILSEMATDGNTDCNIEPFKFSRPILQLDNPPKNFMI